MGWKIHQKKDIPKMKKLILKKEWAYVSFSARFREYVENGFGLKNDCTILVNQPENGNAILEAVMLLRQGVILPLLEISSDRDQSMTLKYLISQYSNPTNTAFPTSLVHHRHRVFSDSVNADSIAYSTIVLSGIVIGLF